ncbi:MAG: DUF1365 domain-containing protein [Steroidobacteraceae bacterium]
MKSCLYIGHIQHRRHTPRRNEFRYRIYMSFLDLDELPTLFDHFWLWSARKPALAWLRRQDFHRPEIRSLSDAVRDTVLQHTGSRPGGPIRLLTHLRYFGYSFNPVSFYYVYDATDSYVETIVAEITNTPWKERHSYVLSTTASSLSTSSMGVVPSGAHQGATKFAPGEFVPQSGEGVSAWRWQFDKQFHVSPFLPMDMQFNWRFSAPEQSLRVHMENWRNQQKNFDATLTLQRVPISSRSLAMALLRFPLVTLQVVTLIHWQALKLLFKRVPFHTHPDKQAESITPSGK